MNSFSGVSDGVKLIFGVLLVGFTVDLLMLLRSPSE